MKHVIYKEQYPATPSPSAIEDLEILLNLPEKAQELIFELVLTGGLIRARRRLAAPMPDGMGWMLSLSTLSHFVEQRAERNLQKCQSTLESLYKSGQTILARHDRPRQSSARAFITRHYPSPIILPRSSR